MKSFSKIAFFWMLAVFLIATIMLGGSALAQYKEPVGKAQPCGVNNSRPIHAANVPAVWQARGRPVARILVDYPGPVDSVGTGFLYDNCCLLTCWHVIRSATPGQVRIEFDCENPAGVIGFDCTAQENCTPDVWEACSLKHITDCDVGVVYIKPRFHPKYGAWDCPGEIYGVVDLDSRVPAEGESVHVIGHPSGRCKEYSHDDNATVINVPDADCAQYCTCGPLHCCVSHGADTEGGSSGSPIFDDNGYVIGIHCCYVPISLPPCRNCFIPMSEIFEDLPWDCFCESYQRVPTLTQWGLIILVVLIVFSTWVVLRRRRTAVSGQ